MIVTESAGSAFRPAIHQMHDAVVQALGIAALEPRMEVCWHATRTVEYPWALQMVQPLRGKKVLDIGAHPPFAISLLHLNQVTDLTLHHTSQDTGSIPLAFLHSAGQFPLKHLWKEHEKVLKLVWGFPDRLDVASGTYDVIFNISVMEHVPRKYVWDWADGIWRMLRPGGRLVMTCDWALDQPAGWGTDGHLVNHDWWEWLQRTPHRALHLNPRETPWHPSFDVGQLQADLFKMTYRWLDEDEGESKGTDDMVVYGVVLEKPA